MKKILLIATGGTIASGAGSGGLHPAIPSRQLLDYVPAAGEFCEIETVQPFFLDSTNIAQKHWLALAALIEQKYEYYDGFVICHGTDTMAYSAAALSYLIQNNRKPVVLTGSQKPIDLAVTDARTNLLDSLRFACHPKAHGVSIVFGGRAIAGTRAKKEFSRSYNAFASINYPDIAVIQESRIVFYIDDKDADHAPLTFYHEMDEKVFLLKLIPGVNGRILDALKDLYDAVIIESFGVGGIPDYEEEALLKALRDWDAAGKVICICTQVTHEGSDLGVYQVGKVILDTLPVLESRDMTLEACVTKLMWALGQTKERGEVGRLFSETVNHDLLFT